MDSLGHQHRAKKLSPKIALHFKVLCESKTTLPKMIGTILPNDIVSNFFSFDTFSRIIFEPFVSNPQSACIYKMSAVICWWAKTTLPNPNQYKKNMYNNNNIIILLNCYFY